MLQKTHTDTRLGRFQLLWKSSVTILACISLAACTNAPVAVQARAASPDLTQATTEALQLEALKRGDLRWKHLFANEFQLAFDFYTTASKVGINPDYLQGYVESLKAQKAVAKKAQCANLRCELTFDLTINMKIPNIPPRSMEIPLREIWVVEQGQLKIIRPTPR